MLGSPYDGNMKAEEEEDVDVEVCTGLTITELDTPYEMGNAADEEECCLEDRLSPVTVVLGSP